MLWWKTIRLGEAADGEVLGGLQGVLSGTGAVLLRHTRRTDGVRQKETWHYRLGTRLLRVRSETVAGLTIRGHARLVERIAAGVGEREEPEIRIHGWGEPPDPAVLHALAGDVVAVIVGAPFRGEPIPLGEFFRLARVLSVTQLSDPEPCRRCAEDSRFRFRLAWEQGYASGDGDVACEHCLAGRVTSGAELANVPEAPSAGIRFEIPLSE